MFFLNWPRDLIADTRDQKYSSCYQHEVKEQKRSFKSKPTVVKSNLDYCSLFRTCSCSGFLKKNVREVHLKHSLKSKVGFKGFLLYNWFWTVIWLSSNFQTSSEEKKKLQLQKLQQSWTALRWDDSKKIQWAS